MERLDDYKSYFILYVDDEEKSLKYFSQAFSHKYKILSAINAADGYKLLKQHQDDIALLMTDQRMPGEKGVEFLQRARQLHPKAIRILTTAYSDFDVAIEAVNSGAISKLVTKPWDLPQLDMILRDACEFYNAQRDRDLATKKRAPARPVLERNAGLEELRTLEQVASYLNVNKFTVYRLVIQKKIPAFKVGNQWRFKQEMIDAWLMAKVNTRKRRSS